MRRAGNKRRISRRRRQLWPTTTGFDRNVWGWRKERRDLRADELNRWPPWPLTSGGGATTVVRTLTAAVADRWAPVGAWPIDRRPAAGSRLHRDRRRAASTEAYRRRCVHR